MKRILVGVDGSPASLAASGWSGRFAVAVGAEVVIAHAFRSQQAEVSPEYSAESRRVAEQRLAGEWSEQLRTSGAAHRSMLLDGTPDALLDAGDRVDADLIVVGPRGHGGFAALHIGSVAHHLAHYTRRPLAIAPEPGLGSGIRRIVIGVDGSNGSAAAVGWCAEVAATMDVEVVAVHAFEPTVWTTPDSTLHALREQAQRDLEGPWVAPLRSAARRVATVIVDRTHPVKALADAIDDEDADLAVVGTRGVGGFTGLRLGRVPLQLVHRAQIPVVLVPAPSTDATEPVERTTAS